MGNKTTKQLATWQQHGLLSAEQASRIAEFEAATQKDGSFSRLIIMLGSFSLVLGLLAIIGANWNSIPDAVKLFAHTILSLGLATGLYLQRDKKGWEKDIFLLLIFGTNLSFIALIGQVFQLQGHPFFAVLTWIVVSTPLLVTQASTPFVAYAWIIGVIVKCFLLQQWLSGESMLPHPQAAMVSAAVSSIYFVLGHVRSIDQRFPLFTTPLRNLSTIGILLGGSVMQIMWRTDFNQKMYDDFWAYAPSLFTTIATYLLVIFLSATKKGVWDVRPAAWFFLATIGALLLPVSFVHPSIPFIGALCFIAYWMAIGYAAYLAGEKKHLDLVIWVISIRLFIVYLEVFGTLATTGVGLIIGGVIFLSLGFAARKLQKVLGGQHAKA